MGVTKDILFLYRHLVIDISLSIITTLSKRSLLFSPVPIMSFLCNRTVRQPFRQFNLHLTRTIFTSRPLLSDTWEGRQPEEHVTNREDTLDIQSAASKGGKQSRAEDSHQSGATSEKDTGNHNERAKKDHPEAPGPVIGMNDERGGVSNKHSDTPEGMEANVIGAVERTLSSEIPYVDTVSTICIGHYWHFSA